MTLSKKCETERSVDLDGPDGNAFVLLGLAAGYARQLKLDEDMVLLWMQSGSYDNLLAVFDHFFGSFCELKSRNEELLDRVAAIDLSMMGD
jgi:hypothetical protein